MVTPRREALAAAQPTAHTHIRPPRHTGTVYDDLTIETWVHGPDPRSRRQSAEGTSVTCRWGAAPRVREPRLRRDESLGARGKGPATVCERDSRGRRSGAS